MDEPRPSKATGLSVRLARLTEWASVTLLVVAHVLVASGLILAARRLSEGRTAGDVEIAAGVMSREANDTMITAQHLAFVFRAQIELMDERQRAALPVDRAYFDSLFDVVRTLPRIEDVIVIDRSGIILATSISFPPPAVNLSDSERYRVMAEGHHGPYLTAPYLGLMSKRPLVSVNLPIRDDTGAFAGLVSVTVRTDEFLGSVGRTGRNRNLVGAWLRADGWLMARLPDGIPPRPMDPAGTGDLMLGRTTMASHAVVEAVFDGHFPNSLATLRLADWPMIAIVGVDPTGSDLELGIQSTFTAFGVLLLLIVALQLRPRGVASGGE